MFVEVEDDLVPRGVQICHESFLQLQEFVVRVSSMCRLKNYQVCPVAIRLFDCCLVSLGQFSLVKSCER